MMATGRGVDRMVTSGVQLLWAAGVERSSRENDSTALIER